MNFSTKVRVGTKMIKCGEVYCVHKIEKITSNNKADRLIYHKPHFVSKKVNTVVCSIPESSLELTTVREPVSKKDIGKLLKNLTRKSKRSLPNTIDAKNIFKINDVTKTALVLKLYWAEQHREDAVFSRSKRDVLDSAIEKVVEEVAIVTGTTPVKAHERVLAALG